MIQLYLSNAISVPKVQFYLSNSISLSISQTCALACSALLASLPRSTALICSLVHSLTPELGGNWMIMCLIIRLFWTIVDWRLDWHWCANDEGQKINEKQLALERGRERERERKGERKESFGCEFEFPGNDRDQAHISWFSSACSHVGTRGRGGVCIDDEINHQSNAPITAVIITMNTITMNTITITNSWISLPKQQPSSLPLLETDQHWPCQKHFLTPALWHGSIYGGENGRLTPCEYT